MCGKSQMSPRQQDLDPSPLPRLAPDRQGAVVASQDVLDDGKAQASALLLPAGIGINAELWKGHEFDDLGINGLAPMHTHAADGYIHIETTKRTTFTLKDFLDVWGVQYNAVKLETVYETNVFGETNYGTIPNPLNYPLGDGQHLRLTLL